MICTDNKNVFMPANRSCQPIKILLAEWLADTVFSANLLRNCGIIILPSTSWCCRNPDALWTFSWEAEMSVNRALASHFSCFFLLHKVSAFQLHLDKVGMHLCCLERRTILEQENSLLSYILLEKMMCLSLSKRMGNIEGQCWEVFSMLLCSGHGTGCRNWRNAD